MTNKGLQFGAATQADQAAYTALYQALLSYDVQLTQAVSR
jgi:hypothetical protein